jgi:hypothetical protein
MTMMTRLSILAALVAAVLLPGAATAYASLIDEVNAGDALAARVDSRAATCNDLSSAEFEHLGEYVMDRMVGSRATHEAMDARMDTMMGSQNADRMHELLGRNYAGCAATSSGGNLVGPGMMGTGMMGGAGGGMMSWGAMMSSSAWNWIHDGTWQHMTRSQWHQHAWRMMGSGVTFDSGGWSLGAVLALIFGSALLGGALVAVGMRLPRRRRPTHPHAG